MATFGERLRELRLAAGMSQVELAGQDLSPSYISLIESGKRQPSTDVVRLFASRLGCSCEDLEEGLAHERRRQIELELAYARLALSHGEAQSALERLERMLAENTMDRRQEDEARLLLGMAHELTDDLESAVRVLLPVHERSLVGRSHLPPSSTGANLSRYYLGSGDLHAAVRVGEQSLQAMAERQLVGTDEYLALASTVMYAYHELGDLTHASVWADQLLDLAQREGLARGQAAVYWNAAIVAESRGEIDEALHLSQRALAHLSEQPTTRDLARLQVTTAWLLLRTSPPRTSEALPLLDRALPTLQDCGSPVDIATWESTRSLAELLAGNAAGAEQRARQALLHLSSCPATESVRALVTLGDCVLVQGRGQEAEEHYAAAARSLASGRSTRQVAALWREIADRLSRAGRFDEALDAYRRALDAAGVGEQLAAARIPRQGPDSPRCRPPADSEQVSLRTQDAVEVSGAGPLET